MMNLKDPAAMDLFEKQLEKKSIRNRSPIPDPDYSSTPPQFLLIELEILVESSIVKLKSSLVNIGVFHLK